MESPESSRSSVKKRAREAENPGSSPSIPDCDDPICTIAEAEFSMSDTLIALRMMHAQFPKLDKVAVKPFVLRSQLYSAVRDRTQVDRDLESLKKEKLLRLFKLNTGQDDHAIMFLNDYLEQCSLLSFGGEVKDKHVTLLINAGLLTRQMIDPNMYWFAIPNIGVLLKGLSQGRKELLSFLNRRKHKEMLLAPLEKKRLRFSPLDMRFHLRDLIGSGHLKTLQTPTGLLVHIPKD